MTERNKTIDKLRGICMLGVLGIHTGSLVLMSVSPNQHLYMLFEILSRYSVPAFFFVSGYGLFCHYKPGTEINYRQFIKKRFQSSGIPYLCWSLFYMVYFTTVVPGCIPWFSPLGLLHILFWGLACYHLYFMIILLWFYAFFPLFQKLLGWNNETDSYQFYILKERVKGEPVLLSRTLLNCSTILKSSIVFQENNLLLLLLNLDHLSISWNELQALLDSLSKGFYCGISAPFRRIEQVSCYYKQALAELVRCKEQHLQRSCGVEHIGDHLLSMLNQNPLNQTYIVPELRILLEYDRREQTHYYETLRAWFYSGFHPTTAAAMLNIHRNSFNYRMDRLRDLIAFARIDSLTANRNLDVLNEYFYSFMYLDAVDSP